jgi:hypothetical protein
MYRICQISSESEDTAKPYDTGVQNPVLNMDEFLLRSSDRSLDIEPAACGDLQEVTGIQHTLAQDSYFEF